MKKYTETTWDWPIGRLLCKIGLHRWGRGVTGLVCRCRRPGCAETCTGENDYYY